MKEIGKMIKDARIKNGLTQMDLAQQLGYKMPQFISQIETGHSVIPLNKLKKAITILRLDRKLILKMLVTNYTNIVNEEI